jgi:uncharacterized protein with WD repeat
MIHNVFRQILIALTGVVTTGGNAANKKKKKSKAEVAAEAEQAEKEKKEAEKKAKLEEEKAKQGKAMDYDVSTMSAEEKTKKVRALRKKLREIDGIKEKGIAEADLTEAQKHKLQGEADLLEKVKELEATM